MSFSDGLPFFNDGDAVASTSTLPQEASTSSTPSSNKAAKGKKRARDGQSNGTNTSNGDNNIEASLAYIPNKDTALPDFSMRHSRNPPATKPVKRSRLYANCYRTNCSS